MWFSSWSPVAAASAAVSASVGGDDRGMRGVGVWRRRQRYEGSGGVEETTEV